MSYTSTSGLCRNYENSGYGKCLQKTWDPAIAWGLASKIKNLIFRWLCNFTFIISVTIEEIWVHGGSKTAGDGGRRRIKKENFLTFSESKPQNHSSSQANQNVQNRKWWLWWTERGLNLKFDTRDKAKNRLHLDWYL